VEIEVNYSTVGAGADGLGLANRDLLQRLEELVGMARSVAEGWTGEAKIAFDANMRVISEELLNIGTVVGQTGGALSNSVASYHAQDRRSAGRILGT
jgi:uncharacterized protein YukE